ncbi:MAG: exo-alpha-sialidase [Bacteroidaceae bacterium]|nr:exo-alpha-sialidase [Bacteroidaceae bacterium]
MTFKNLFLTLTTAFLLAATAAAQTVLFHTGDYTGYPYRIPAICTAVNGDLIALSDIRPCGNDIGYGRVDILMRTSKDNGATWSYPVTVLAGTGEGEEAGYGDACLVADRERNELLLVCVSGDVPYWSSKIGHTQRIVCTHARLNERTGRWEWNKRPIDLTQQVYEGLLGNRINGLFMGSGRICQSRTVKVGDYYRVYGALCTHGGNFVIYSDDFGRNWHLLGTPTESCAPKGDEPKCEELPDGSVLLSSRKDRGRWFNIFKFTDVKSGAGAWGTPVASDETPGGIRNEGRATDGEILLLDVTEKATGKDLILALQSVPAGPNRQKVTIYWKPLRTPTDYDTPQHFAEQWEGQYQVSNTGSAYSTMSLQHDKRIAFFYEEEPAYYQMVYLPLDLETITAGRYAVK